MFHYETSPGKQAENIWKYLGHEKKTLPGAALAACHMLITNSKEQNGSRMCSKLPNHSIKMLIEAAVGWKSDTLAADMYIAQST